MTLRIGGNDNGFYGNDLTETQIGQTAGLGSEDARSANTGAAQFRKLPPIPTSIEFVPTNIKGVKDLMRAELMAAAAAAGIATPREQAAFADFYQSKYTADLGRGGKVISDKDARECNGKPTAFLLNGNIKRELTMFRETYAAAHKPLVYTKRPRVDAGTLSVGAVNAAIDPNAALTNRHSVIISRAGGGATKERVMLQYVKERFGNGNLQIDNFENIARQAESSNLNIQLTAVTPMGDKYRVAFKIAKTDDARLQQLANAEQIKVNNGVDAMDKTVRNTVANRFTQGFFNGAYSDLKANAAMVYSAATDPLGTAWKVGEALVTIPLLPTKIGVQLGQAAIELSNLKPEQRQALVDELINKGYTGLRDLPVGDAAEKAGEIVGTIAMEAILAKGAGAAGKVSLEGLEALKGTKFAAQITELAKTTKTAIAETKVPVRATVQTMADTAGGTRKVLNVESKSLGEVFQNLEARAKQVLSSGAEDAARVKPISLPKWEKLTFRVDAGETKPHFLTGHQEGGGRLAQSQKAGGEKDVFPIWMTENQITNAIKAAYKNAKVVKTQNFFEGKVITVEGQANGLKIRIHINVDLKQLDSAYPIRTK